jgi:hypothetical protein
VVGLKAPAVHIVGYTVKQFEPGKNVMVEGHFDNTTDSTLKINGWDTLAFAARPSNYKDVIATEDAVFRHSMDFGATAELIETTALPGRFAITFSSKHILTDGEQKSALLGTYVAGAFNYRSGLRDRTPVCGHTEFKTGNIANCAHNLEVY